MKEQLETSWTGVGVGGSISLDFVNTLDWRLREAPVELLQSFTDLLRWARTADVLDAREARVLRSWAASHPRKAARVVADAIALRETIAALFQDLARGRAADSAAVERLDAACRRAWETRSLVGTPRGVRWGWREAGPERPAFAAALDAARILTSAESGRIRQCGDAECGWMFLDTSRNRSRVWCSMEDCGNRNKARRFYRRRKRS